MPVALLNLSSCGHARTDQTIMSSSKSPELSVVMPCLNEAETLGACIKKVCESFRRHDIDGEIIVADNGSDDGSQDIAEQMGAKVVHVVERGYGNALMSGITAARGKYVLMGDSDDSYDFTALNSFFVKLREGYDLVMGNRFKGGIMPGAMPFMHRFFGNPLLTWVGRLFFGRSCGDFYCGIRGFRRNAIMYLDLRTTGMEFALEMVVKATLRNLRITEIPTTLSPDGRTRAPHLRTWRDGWRSIRFFLLYSPRWLFLFPGFLLIIIGLISGAFLLPGPVSIGNITFDAHTLLYSAVAILIGSQSVLFSAFTKVFAVHEGLLPDDDRLEKLFRIFSLEKGLILGGTFTLAGLIFSIYAVSDWGANFFGPLDYARMMRIVIPSGLALSLGCQIILSSFFLSVLRLGRK